MSTERSKNKGRGTESNEEQHTVVDFTEYRAQRLEDKRRKNERILINHFLGVYAVYGGNSLYQVELMDISDDGCSFQVPIDANKPWGEERKEFTIRLYFSQESYLSIPVSVQNKKTVSVNGNRFTRYGCSVDTTASTYDAYSAYVHFLKAYSIVSQNDAGNVNVFFV
jgi:hypothetical protein